jgi:hypothetical protein
MPTQKNVPERSFRYASKGSYETFSIYFYLMRKDYITASSTSTTSTLITAWTTFSTVIHAVTTTSTISPTTSTNRNTAITTIATYTRSIANIAVTMMMVKV